MGKIEKLWLQPWPRQHMAAVLLDEMSVDQGTKPEYVPKWSKESVCIVVPCTTTFDFVVSIVPPPTLSIQQWLEKGCAGVEGYLILYYSDIYISDKGYWSTSGHNGELLPKNPDS